MAVGLGGPPSSPQALVTREFGGAMLRSGGPSLFVRFSLGFKRLRLAAIRLRQVREALGNFGVARGLRLPLGLVGLLPKELAFLHHRATHPDDESIMTTELPLPQARRE